jgi:cytochrome c oxidase cbb3-type subunit 3
MRTFYTFAGCLVVAALLIGCASQGSTLSPSPELGDLPRGNPVTPFQPGTEDKIRAVSNRLEETDAVIGDGQRLYNYFNCSGCHAAGGGAIGPPLMDDEWIYGKSAGNIFWSIVEGRPQGMPSFAGKISEDQVWSLVAYVRSLSSLGDIDSASSQAGEKQPAVANDDPVQRGRQVFLTGPCPLCHTIRGTSALATVGPDLTHLASQKILIGSLPNTRGNLAGWILNPQNLDPETEMPPTPLAPQELHDLLDFLATLK